MADFLAVGGMAVEAVAGGGLEVEGQVVGRAGDEVLEDGEFDVGGDKPFVGEGEDIGVYDRPQGNGMFVNNVAAMGIAGG